MSQSMISRGSAVNKVNFKWVVKHMGKVFIVILPLIFFGGVAGA